MSNERLRDALRDVGERRRAALKERKRTSEELAVLVPKAHAAGVTQSEISDLTGLSRQGVRDFLRDSH